MEKVIKSLAGMLFLAGGLQAQVKHRVEVKEVKVLVQQTPQFQVVGPKEKRIEPRFWIEMGAELEVESTSERGDIPYISELQVNWYAVLDDTVGLKREPVMLVGKSDYKMVPTKNKKVLVSAYIEPDVLERFTGKERPTEGDLKGFAVVISGTDVLTEGKYGLKLFKAEGDGKKIKWWEKWERETKNDFIVPKSKTPFAPLWADLYPSEKVE